MKDYSKIDRQKYLSYLFHPSSGKFLPAQDDQDVDIVINEEVRLGCRFFLADREYPTILYFHGNGETPSDYNQIAPLYVAKNLNFFVATYRGYGRSSGTPSVASMMSDAKIVFKYLKTKMAELEMNESLFVMGRSIGSAAAIELCATYADDIKGLIVESGFADTLPLLENIGLSLHDEELKEEDGFGNLDKIQDIKLPTLILHGAEDILIPFKQAERLQSFSGAKAKKFFLIPRADHNSIIAVGGDNYFLTIRGFISDLVGEYAWIKLRKRFRKNRKKDDE